MRAREVMLYKTRGYYGARDNFAQVLCPLFGQWRVSYTDHSHIIGKGGNTIRRVMAETNCHIHFPDSNRSNPNEKSNQVNITNLHYH